MQVPKCPKCENTERFMNDAEREMFMDLCLSGMLPCDKLRSEDSLKQLGQAFSLLKAGYEYTVTAEIRGCHWLQIGMGLYYIPSQKLLERCNGEDWYYADRTGL